MTEHDDILVSAIVSVYRAERFIRGCMEDLCNQTLFVRGGLEIVVVNSNSSENEEPIIREFVYRHPDRIRYLRTGERETIYQAWNRGVTAARGRYLTNANADDRHRPDALEVMARCLDAHPDCALAYADSNVTQEENHSFVGATIVARFAWPDFDPLGLFRVCYVGPHPMWRRSLHERYGMFDPLYHSAGDYEFWLRLVAGGERFIHIRDVLGLYLQSPGGVEHGNQKLSWEESERARKVHWPAAWGMRPRPEGCYLEPVAPLVTPSGSPLVSVVVPTYNRPDFLAKALQSILDQSYANFEVLVVNDGGIDVQELVDYFNLPGRKIRYFPLSCRVERSAARNHALREAKGKYIAYLDDDDIYYPDHLETLVTFLESNDYRFAYTDGHRTIQQRVQGDYRTVLQDVPYSRDFDPAYLLASNYIPILCIMHERSCLDDVGMFDEELSCHEDWELWIRMAQRYRFGHVQKVTCAYSFRVDGSSTTSAARPRFLSSYRQIVGRYRHLAIHRPEVVRKQQQIVMGYIESVYEFLQGRITGLSSWHAGALPETDELLDLCASGATEQQILSVWYSLKAGAAIDADPHDAVLLLRKSLALDPDNVLALRELARVSARMGDWRGAASALECLWAMNPGEAALREMLTTAYRQYDHERAALFLKQAENALPQSVRSVTARGCSIIIPLFNQLAYTRNCLEALKRHTDPSLIEEIILVDNGSEDGTREYLATLDGCTVIRNERNLGFAKACNQGAKASTSPWLLFLNNDTEPQPGWLEPLLDILVVDPAVAAAGSKLLYPDGTIQHAGIIIANDRQLPDPLRAGNNCVGQPADAPKANRPARFQALTAACLLVRKDAFEAAGGFDEGYWNGYEDVDLCFKLGQLGWELVYQPASVVVHHESKSGADRFVKYQQNVQRLHDKWCGIIRPDVIVTSDGSQQAGPAMLEGVTALYTTPERVRVA